MDAERTLRDLTLTGDQLSKGEKQDLGCPQWVRCWGCKLGNGVGIHKTHRFYLEFIVVFLFFNVYECFVLCMCIMQHVYAQCLSSEDHITSPRTGNKDCCEPSSGCWEVNPGALKELHVLLITKTSFQPLQNKNKILILWWASEIPAFLQQDGRERIT